MRSIALLSIAAILYVFYVPLFLVFVVPTSGQRLVPPRQYHQHVDDEQRDHDTTKRLQKPHLEDIDTTNETDDEQYLGDPCDNECSPMLINAFCSPATKTCECKKKFPVKLTAATGCTKPKQIGEQCLHEAACKYYDQHATCKQIGNNAICQCQSGYHSVSVTKPSKKLFCAEDLVVMTTDFSTFAGVVSGIAVLSGLICFVLKLFNQNLYQGRHRYGNANLAPPILFNSDGDTTTSSQPIYGSFLAVRDVTGSVPIIDHHHNLHHLQQRRGLVSRASSQRTLTYTTSSRRPSSAPGSRIGYASGGGSGGVSVPASRAGAARAAAILLLSCHQQVTAIPEICSHNGSRRPSIASVHSSNSIRSYSMRRYEKEREQKEEREMQRRLARLTSSAANSTGRIPPTPSPHSTDDLLPTLEEDERQSNVNTNQVPLALSEESASNSFHEEVPSTSKQFP